MRTALDVVAVDVAREVVALKPIQALEVLPRRCLFCLLG